MKGAFQPSLNGSDHDQDMRAEWRQIGWIAIASFGFTGALVACYFAWVFRALPCETAICTSSSVRDGQMILALVGLLPAAVLLYAVAQRRTRLAMATLMAGLAIYAAWALLVGG